MGQQHTASEEMFIKSQVEEAMTNGGVLRECRAALGAFLVSQAEVEMSGRVAAVRIRDDHGRVLSLLDRLAEMKDEFMYRHNFCSGPPVVSASDLRTTRDNFAEIASGRVRVE